MFHGFWKNIYDIILKIVKVFNFYVSGGLLALASKTQKNEVSDRYMQVAKEITRTCHESYARTATKLGPEAFRFTEGVEARSLKSSEKYYILRPEVVETYFYLYRLTKDNKYREWGWEAVQVRKMNYIFYHYAFYVFYVNISTG